MNDNNAELSQSNDSSHNGNNKVLINDVPDNPESCESSTIKENGDQKNDQTQKEESKPSEGDNEELNLVEELKTDEEKSQNSTDQVKPEPEKADKSTIQSNLYQKLTGYPLVDIAMNILCDCNDTKITDPKIKETFLKFVNGVISYDNALLVTGRYNGAQEALSRLKRVLSTRFEAPINSLINPFSTFHPWTENDDSRLIMAVYMSPRNDWNSIASFVGNNRSSNHCYQRWFRCLDPRLSKAPWTNEEVKSLIEICTRYGIRDWNLISSELGTRSDFQCKLKYYAVMKSEEIRKYQKPLQIAQCHVIPNIKPKRVKISEPSAAIVLPQKKLFVLESIIDYNFINF